MLVSSLVLLLLLFLLLRCKVKRSRAVLTPCYEQTSDAKSEEIGRREHFDLHELELAFCGQCGAAMCLYSMIMMSQSNELVNNT